MTYDFTEDMGDISGFASRGEEGRKYEQACRLTIKAACEWLDAHPDAKPQFRSYDGVNDVCEEVNEDAKELSKAACAAVESIGGATGSLHYPGAMHEVCLSHAFFIKKNGWDEFKRRMQIRKANQTIKPGDVPMSEE